MVTFENYDRKIEKINKALAAYGISGLEDAQKICEEKGIDPYKLVKESLDKKLSRFVLLQNILQLPLQHRPIKIDIH